MYTLEFSDFVKSLEKSTFERIAIRYYQERYDDDCHVECSRNMVFDDDDLTRFLAKLGAEITEYNGDHIIIETERKEIYKVASEDRTNRFGLDCPETVLFFDKIEKVTDNNTDVAVEPDENGKLDINCIPVVITYSFDVATPVLLFSSEDDAIKYIEKDFENEKRISVEENGYEIDEDETYFNKQEGYAKLTIAGKAEEDVTEWRIGSLY